jgi:hypothetical protein
MDLDDFYDGDPRRGRSPEVRFGGHWLDASGYAYAVGWLEHTGELYAVRYVAHSEGLHPLANPLVNPWIHVLPRRDHHVETEVFVLLVEPSRSRVDALLNGWPDLQGQPEGFEGLVGRLDEAGYPPPWERDGP